MPSNELDRYVKFRNFQRGKFYHYIVIPVLMALTYLIVYLTDNKVYGHAMYIPIIYASFALGHKHAIAVGFIGGIVLGPLIPFSVETGEPQETIQWVFRLVMFTLIGFFSGLLIYLIKKNSLRIVNLLSYNQETNLPNKNGLKLLNTTIDLEKPKTIVSLVINNYDILIELFNNSVYHKLIKEIANILKTELPNTTVIHPEDNKLWLTTETLDKDLIVNTITTKVTNDIVIDDVNFYVDLSIGLSIATCKEDYHLQQTYRNADTAAKHAQKNHLVYSIYDGNKINHQQDFELLGSFLQALENEEIYLDYQPIINLKTNKIDKFEALVRWNHPTRGFIRPDNFIPLIEQTQLVHSLSNWVLLKVIEKIKEFEEQNISLKFSINISANNLYSEDFINKLIEIKNFYKIKDFQIELELTETQELVRSTSSIETLIRLREHGFDVAIDDFGKGYSSLSSLHMFPASTFKIDSYFSKQLEEDSNVIHIIEGVIVFAHKQGIKVLFEGIENKTVDQKIRAIDSDYGQGYYYSRPIHQDKILEFYQNNDGYIFKNKKAKLKSVLE